VQFAILLVHLPHLMHVLALFNSVQADFDEDDEKIVLCGPKCQDKRTCPQAGQAEFSGICPQGMERFDQLCVDAKLGRTPQGLKIEQIFLAKCRADKGILAPTQDEERARRNRRGGGACQVAVPPVMDTAAVKARFDEQMLGTWLGIFACIFDI